MDAITFLRFARSLEYAIPKAFTSDDISVIILCACTLYARRLLFLLAMRLEA